MKRGREKVHNDVNGNDEEKEAQANNDMSVNSVGESSDVEKGEKKIKINPVRASPEDQQDTSRYVPNRLRRLRKRIRSEAEHQEGGNRAKMMICQRCKEKIQFSSNTTNPNQDMFDHMYKCWLPKSEPPNKAFDEGKVKPNHSGQIAMERDIDCLIFSIFSAGPYRGAYHLVMAVPVESATLSVLDHGLRVHWFNEGCYHGAMFYKKVLTTSQIQTSTDEFHLSQENKLENEAVIINKSMGQNDIDNLNVADTEEFEESNFQKQNMEISDQSCVDDNSNNSNEIKLQKDNGNINIEGWIEPGSLYWSKNPSETFWVSMVMPDPETGLTCRRYHEDKTEIWPQLFGQVWHVVYIGRQNRRAWVHLKDMEVYQKGKEDVRITYNTAGDQHPGFQIKDEDKKEWLAAIEIANEVKHLSCSERINWLKDNGLCLDGPLDAEESYTDCLVKRYGEKETERIFAMWEEKKERLAWGHDINYQQQLKDEDEKKYPKSVIKHMDGWEIWPLIGREDEITDRVEPDRTDTDLTEIFKESGEWAMYQYGLDDGVSTKCKIIFKERKMLRLKGTLKSTSCRTLLKRDPEYEEDIRLEKEQMDEDELDLSTDEDPDLIIKYIEPSLDKVTLLMENEPPYTPCIVCKNDTAQFLDNGNVPFDREAKQSHFEKLYLFCSVSCARKWGKENERNLPMGLCYYVDNSPRTGVCCHQHDDMGNISLHILPESTLQIMKRNRRKAWKEGDRIPYEDAERATGRPHPLWDNDRKFIFRWNKRRWQDAVLKRMEKFGLGPPPLHDTSADYFDY